ncbi:hypothetical protein LXA43DRAFT_541076 [Ganoderma leucocontextum]|nr:hypothetical protein LXA43DRAFT_541076 [Ganoderma leucocontextum]
MPKDTGHSKKRASTGGQGRTTASLEWPASELDLDAKITKGKALDRYQLKPDQLRGLEFQRELVDTNGRRVWAHVYSEREVEQRAWELYGGPDGLQVQITGPLPEKEELFDPEKALDDLRDRLAPWQWTAFNKALDIWHKCNHSRRSAVWYRISGLRLSLKIAKTYPQRPSEPLPSSPAVDRLRAVLAQAASLPTHGSEKYGEEVEGLSRTGGPPHAWTYDWSDEYLQKLFSALIDVIKVGKVDRDFDKWKAIRWEVYDRFVECTNKGPMFCWWSTGWTDPAAEWLEGGLSERALTCTYRARCPAGKEYNHLPRGHGSGFRSIAARPPKYVSIYM